VLEIEIAAGKDLALVWEEEGEILGYACAHDLGFRAYLSDLIVAETARNRGIGRQLLEHIEAKLRQRGCPVIFSDVWRTAESFYRSLGWSEPDVSLLRKRLEMEPSP
jgi:GNAT superfamily N-acetyltransferase